MSSPPGTWRLSAFGALCLVAACGAPEVPVAEPIAVGDPGPAEDSVALGDSEGVDRTPSDDADTVLSPSDLGRPTLGGSGHPPLAGRAPAPPDDSVVPPLAVVVPLFGIDGCVAPPHPHQPPRVRTVNDQPPIFPILRRVVRRQANAALRQCYAPTTAHAACRNVTANVALAIAPDGRVVQTQAAATETAMARCVESALARLRFPEPEGGGMVVLRFPMRFVVSRE